MNNTMTFVLEVVSKESQTLDTLCDSLINNKIVDNIKVRGGAHEDLFDKLERIEEIIGLRDKDSCDKLQMISSVLKGEDFD